MKSSKLVFWPPGFGFSRGGKQSRVRNERTFLYVLAGIQISVQKLQQKGNRLSLQPVATALLASVQPCKLRPTRHLTTTTKTTTTIIVTTAATIKSNNRKKKGAAAQKAYGGLRHGPTSGVAGGLGGSHLSFCKTHYCVGRTAKNRPHIRCFISVPPRLFCCLPRAGQARAGQGRAFPLANRNKCARWWFILTPQPHERGGRASHYLYNHSSQVLRK